MKTNAAYKCILIRQDTKSISETVLVRSASKSKEECDGVGASRALGEKTRSAAERERGEMRLLLKNAAQVLQVVDDRRPFLRGEQEMKSLALIENGSIVVDAE